MWQQYMKVRDTHANIAGKVLHSRKHFQNMYKHSMQGYIVAAYVGLTSQLLLTLHPMSWRLTCRKYFTSDCPYCLSIPTETLKCCNTIDFLHTSNPLRFYLKSTFFVKEDYNISTGKQNIFLKERAIFITENGHFFLNEGPFL